MAEQYLWDQLNEHIITDQLEDILKQLDKHTHTKHTHTEQTTKNTQDRNHKINMPHEIITPNSREDNSQTNRKVNNGQKISDDNIPFHKNTEENS